MTHYFIMIWPNKREIQQIASNHSSDNKFKDLIKIYKHYTKQPYTYLVNNKSLLSDNQ